MSRRAPISVHVHAAPMPTGELEQVRAEVEALAQRIAANAANIAKLQRATELANLGMAGLDRQVTGAHNALDRVLKHVGLTASGRKSRAA